MKEIKQPSTILKSEADVWKNLRTGEEIVATEILKKIERSGFVIAYLSTIIEMLETLGNKKMQVVKHILRNMDYNNVYVVTTNELAEKVGVSKITVITTLKILETHQIISRRTGAIMVNPKLLHTGRANKEQALLTRFHEFDKT